MKSYYLSLEKPKAKHAFKSNDNHASVFVRREGHSITAEHRASMGAGKAKRKTSRLPHSAAKLTTFRKNARLIDLNKTPGTPYFFTLKPLNDIEPGHLNKVLIGLTRLLRTACAEYIYIQKWARHEKTPHVHLVANIPGDTIAEVEAFAERVIRYWLKEMPKNISTRIKQDARPVYDAIELFGYISKGTPDEFNDRAVATGKDWSVINVTGRSRGWEESKFIVTEVSREIGLEVKREMKRVSSSRGVKLSKRPKGCDDETKRTISEVSPFTISGLSRTESARLLAQVIDNQPQKERQFLIEMRDLYRQAHERASQEVKSEIERLLLNKGYDMHHMFPKWEAPQMNRSERYNADPIFRQVCNALKVVRAARRRSPVSVSSMKE
ncbi:TPA: hypothetical protein PCJ88_000429 [Klebsiella quasipneumoniae]|nr:hypothetical protein [Klebsiella quasipneumoniae]